MNLVVEDEKLAPTYKLSGAEYETLRRGLQSGRFQGTAADFQAVKRMFHGTEVQRKRFPLMGPGPNREQLAGMIRAAIVAPLLKEEEIRVPPEGFFKSDGMAAFRVNDTLQVVLDSGKKRSVHVVKVDIATCTITVRYEDDKS